VDEAFLRRSTTRFSRRPTRNRFLEIFTNCCREKGIEYRPDIVGACSSNTTGHGRSAPWLSARDLINQAISLAEYLGQPPELTTEVLQAACASYFVDDREAEPTYA
jgi:hypothetical protein